MAIFRNIMAFLGGLAIVLGAIFGFGMLNKDFRTFVCSVLGAVPQQEYQVVIEEKDNLMLELENTTVEIDSLTADRDNMIVERDNLVVEVDNLNREIDNLNMDRMYLEDRIRMLEDDLVMSDDRIEQYRQEIDMLNDQIFMLNDEIMRLHDDIRFYDDEIVRLNDEISSLLNEIDNLNAEINRLNNELLTISTTLENATLQYLGNYATIEYTINDGSGSWTECNTGSGNATFHYMGNELENMLVEYKNALDKFNLSIENQEKTFVHVFNFYSIEIDNNNIGLETLAHSYEVAQDVGVNFQLVYQNENIDTETFLEQVNLDGLYMLDVDYIYNLNIENKVISLTCKIVVELLSN